MSCIFTVTESCVKNKLSIKEQGLPLRSDSKSIEYSLNYKTGLVFPFFYLLFVLWTYDLACVWMSSELSLLSLSCLFSWLSECVSLHWPSFRSYWEMAAPLKFNPLSHHSPQADKWGRWVGGGGVGGRDSRDRHTRIYMNVSNRRYARTHTHSFPKS